MTVRFPLYVDFDFIGFPIGCLPLVPLLINSDFFH